MSLKIKQNKKVKDIETRLKKLPVYHVDYIDSLYKRYATDIVTTYKDGIKKNELDLEPLKEVSIAQKSKRGYPEPETPLYGKDDPRSLSNVLKIRKINNGYRIYPSWAKHYSMKISLRDLFKIHEYGAVINVTPKMRAFLHYINIHLRQTTGVIRIPGRHALENAYEKYMKAVSKKDISQTYKRAITRYINTGKEDYLIKMVEIELNKIVENKGEISN